MPCSLLPDCGCSVISWPQVLPLVFPATKEGFYKFCTKVNLSLLNRLWFITTIRKVTNSRTSLNPYSQATLCHLTWWSNLTKWLFIQGLLWSHLHQLCLGKSSGLDHSSRLGNDQFYLTQIHPTPPKDRKFMFRDWVDWRVGSISIKDGIPYQVTSLWYLAMII